MAISAIKSLTSDYIALIVSESALILQDHASTYPTACAPVRDRDVNLSKVQYKVVLNVRSGDSAGRDRCCLLPRSSRQYFGSTSGLFK